MKYRDIFKHCGYRGKERYQNAKPLTHRDVLKDEVPILIIECNHTEKKNGVCSSLCPLVSDDDYSVSPHVVDKLNEEIRKSRKQIKKDAEDKNIPHIS